MAESMVQTRAPYSSTRPDSKPTASTCAPVAKGAGAKSIPVTLSLSLPVFVPALHPALSAAAGTCVV
jgi:hypothetical protein